MGQCQQCINFSTQGCNSLVSSFQDCFDVNSKKIGMRFERGMESAYLRFKYCRLGVYRKLMRYLKL